jgi:hypothetical protein
VTNLALALSVVLGAATLEPGSTSAPLVIEVRGNEVLPEALYLALLGPQASPLTPELMDQLASKTVTFLHDAGYALASVDAHAEGTTLVLDVNEGLLDRVVFKGRLTFQMLRLKLALDLPHEVFNRPVLEQQLEALSAQLGIEAPTWVLVPSAAVTHLGPQLNTLGQLGTLKGAALVRPRQPYELQLVFSERAWGTGFNVDVRSSYFDGLELGVNYQGRSALFEDDRWRVAASGGLGIRRDVVTSSFYVFPSRAFAEALYFTPEAGKVRGFVWLRSEVLARQRPDLGLENSTTATSEVSVNAHLQASTGVHARIGFGVQHFALFGEVAPLGNPALPPYEAQRWRGFGRLGIELLFDTPNGRWDRRHAFELDGRLFNDTHRFDRVTMGEAHLQYQKVFALGWHDLWVKARGTWLTGDVLYPFEEPLGEHLRAVFGDVFTRAAFSGRGEFRFSLNRDVVKVGAFVDGAAYGERDLLTAHAVPRFGVAFGPSFHALIEGMFQMDLAVSFALLSTGRFNTGLYAVLVKVF